MPPKQPIETLEILVTAEEAFPALERLFLSAEREIRAGFRIFDLRTRLRSQAAKSIGETWFDLFKHTLNRGVSINLMLSDFDPIVGNEYHRKSWQTAQQLTAANEVSQRGNLDFRIALHPAKAGVVPRALLWAKVRERLTKKKQDDYTPALRKVSPDSFFDLSPVTHHQKLAVFDQKTLYIGGLDLDERRYDTVKHSQEASATWQDVQAIVTGNVALAAHRHLETIEETVAGTAVPPSKSRGFIRTVAAKRGFAPFRISPKTLITEVEDTHLAAISRSEGIIYLETQFFRHKPLAKALANAARAKPGLHLIMVLPAAPEDVAFGGGAGSDARMGEHLQAEAIASLRDAFGSRALICSPAQTRSAEHTGDRSSLDGAPIIYVHSKVSIFDDKEATLSSANLNGRSFRWDTEAGIHLTQQAHVRQIAKRMSSHWMPASVGLHGANPAKVVESWRKEIESNRQCQPSDRTSFLLPHDEAKAAEIGKAVPIVPDELV